MKAYYNRKQRKKSINPKLCKAINSFKEIDYSFLLLLVLWVIATVCVIYGLVADGFPSTIVCSVLSIETTSDNASEQIFISIISVCFYAIVILNWLALSFMLFVVKTIEKILKEKSEKT